ncbi:hypothetical protein VNI00_015996 [Paramarasmius palmivorus]|uniref:Uncharacterized protein n=1 Tax=Paramarasmius palmivorus TaxID=297713 RepID=A0AAW0BHG5_9AGAR
MGASEEKPSIEEWGDYEGQNAEDEKPLLCPVENLKEGFNSALSGEEFGFKGTFAHSITYKDAPNPFLNLQGIGPIGIPLNEVQSSMIIESSAPGIIVDTDQGIWKFPGERYTDAFANESSNHWRSRWLDQMLVAATSSGDSTVVEWCIIQREAMLDILQTLKTKDVELVVSLLRSKNDPTHYLRHTFVRVAISISKLTALLDLYPASGKCGRPFSLHGRPQKTSMNEPVIDVIHLCIRYDASDMIKTQFLRMWEGRTAQDATYPQQPAVSYVRLLDRLPAIIEDKTPQVKDSCAVFFEHALQLMLPKYSSYLNSAETALQNIQDPIGVLKRWALTIHIDLMSSYYKLTAEYLKTMDQGTVEDLAKSLSNTLRSKVTTQESRAQLEEILELCLRRAVESLYVSSSSSESQGASYQYRLSPSAVIDLLELCLTIQLSSRIDIVLANFLQPPKADDTGYIENGLALVLQALPKFLTEHDLSLTQAPFSAFAAEVTRKFTQRVLGQKPADMIPIDELKTVGCGCKNCSRYIVPFLPGQDARLFISEKQSIRTHIEGQVREKAMTRKWGTFTFTTHPRPGHPYTLEIEKPQRLAAMGQWRHNQTKAQTLLEVLGAVQDQQRILGEDYHWVVGVILGTAAPPPAAAVLASFSTRDGAVLKRSLSCESEVHEPKKPRLA